VALGANTLTVGGADTSTSFAGVLSGNGNFVKDGLGAVTLSGDSSGFNGGTTVTGGTLVAANNNALGSGAVTMTEGSTFAANGVTLANNFTIGADGTVTNFGSTTVLAGWDFNDVTGYGTNDFQANTLAAGVNNPTGLTRGAGVGTGGSAAARGWGGTTWNSASQAAAITAEQFVTFTLTADPNTVLRFDSVDPFEYRRSGSGATLGALQYSTDGVSFTDITTSISYSSDSNAGSTIAAIDLSTIADLESGATLTFRLVNWAASGTGTWYLFDVGNDAGTDDFALRGQVGTVSSGSASGSGTLGISEAGTATFSGNIVNNNDATFTAASGGLATFSGAVSGAGTMQKTGAGTVTLSGASANTFTGMTTVSAGTLQLNKTAGTDALAGAVTVNSGAVLLIAASNQVKDGSAVSLSGGTIRTAAGVNEVFGNLSVIGSGFLDFGATSFETANTISFGAYTPSALLTIDNFNFGSTLTFGTDLTGTIGESSLFQFENGGFASTSWDGSTFTITAIPEPSTYLAAAGLIGLMLWPSRKRLLKDAKKILGLTPPMRDRLARRASEG
jgi:fibronectin-binding autotransporter adhesin